jgi:hypothetical protein
MDRPRIGHQPQYIFYILNLILNFNWCSKFGSRHNTKYLQAGCVCANHHLFSTNLNAGTLHFIFGWRFGVSQHCEKSLFVLASRQKIPVLRTENPAVDTRTICLLPIEFFKLPMLEKLQPEIPGQKQQIRPENLGLLVPEKVRPENPGK